MVETDRLPRSAPSFANRPAFIMVRGIEGWMAGRITKESALDTTNCRCVIGELTRR